jgi:hypothetical protein
MPRKICIYFIIITPIIIACVGLSLAIVAVVNTEINWESTNYTVVDYSIIKGTIWTGGPIFQYKVNQSKEKDPPDLTTRSMIVNCTITAYQAETQQILLDQMKIDYPLWSQGTILYDQHHVDDCKFDSYRDMFIAGLVVFTVFIVLGIILCCNWHYHRCKKCCPFRPENDLGAPLNQ